MKNTVLLSVSLLCLVATLVGAHNHVYKSTLPSNGANCTLAEAQSSKEMTTLFMKCDCKDQSGEKQTYLCQYKSMGRKAYDCKEGSRNHLDFMEVMFKKMSEGGACSLEQVEMDTGDCEGTTFTRAWQANTDAPCVIQKRQNTARG